MSTYINVRNLNNLNKVGNVASLKRSKLTTDDIEGLEFLHQNYNML